MSEPVPRLIVLTLTATGLLVWASCFGLLYAVLSIGCLAGWQQHTLLGMNALSWTLIAIGILHLLTLLVFLPYIKARSLARLELSEDMQHFLKRLTWIIALAGITGVAFITFPAVMLEPCVSHMWPVR